MTELHTVAKAIVLHDGKLLALRRSNTDTRRPLQWDLPGGEVEPGEDIKAACVREIEEETEIVAAVSDCLSIYAMTDTVASNVEACFLFFLVPVATADVILSTEHSESAWMTLDEALRKFTYARQLAALQYARQHQLID